jgi:hypothetical protein
MQIGVLVNDITPEQAAEIDDLGEMVPWIKDYKAKVAAYEKRVKALVAALTEGAPADQCRVAQGNRFTAELGEQAKQRKLKDLGALIKILTPQVFLQIAKVNIGDITAYVPAHQLDEVLVTERTETRAVSFKKRETA